MKSIHPDDCKKNEEEEEEATGLNKCWLSLLSQ